MKINQVRENAINSDISYFLKSNPQESNLTYLDIKSFVSDKSPELICQWCEDNDITVSEHKIKDATNQEIKETLCMGCYQMYSSQMADALDDFR